MKRFTYSILLLLIAYSYAFAQESKNEINFEKEEEMRKAMYQDKYKFSVIYRLQVGYLQQWQHSTSDSYADTHLYGPEIGVTFDFNLPYNFTIQTGLMYGLTYGTNSQHWRNISNENYEEQSIKHRILSHQLSIPVFVTYSVKLWKELSMIFYTGPEISIGIAQNDYLKSNLNSETEQWLSKNNIPVSPYERYTANELFRTNVQYDIGGGLQWDRYRLVGGYKFGLNNLVKQNYNIEQQMWNWTVNVTFSYIF